MKSKRCFNCRCKFYPDPRAASQKYCSKEQCQRSRRNRWNLIKLKRDKDYKITRTAAQYKWRIKNRKNRRNQIITKVADGLCAINTVEQTKEKQLAEMSIREPVFKIVITAEMLTRLIRQKTIDCKLILS